MTTCEACGAETGASYPADPEVMAVVVCTLDCARKLAPLPTGYGFLVADKEAGR